MDLVAARRVALALQRTAKAEPKIVNTSALPPTSALSIDRVVSELVVVEIRRQSRNGNEPAKNRKIETILSQVSRDFYSRVL
jgi:acyl CoA:acetate/3-ketoacid CoA transferase beta subunit